MTENEISAIVLDCAIEVHKTLGGMGLLESAYEEPLCWELQKHGLKVERQVSVPITYKGASLASPLRLDILVEGKVIIEVKAVTAYNTIFEAQVLTYLRLMGLRLGLVINFGAKLVKDGFHRVANRLQ